MRWGGTREGRSSWRRRWDRGQRRGRKCQWPGVRMKWGAAWSEWPFAGGLVGRMVGCWIWPCVPGCDSLPSSLLLPLLLLLPFHFEQRTVVWPLGGEQEAEQTTPNTRSPTKETHDQHQWHPQAPTTLRYWHHSCPLCGHCSLLTTTCKTNRHSYHETIRNNLDLKLLIHQTSSFRYLTLIS